jgi:hypothetical protein
MRKTWFVFAALAFPVAGLLPIQPKNAGNEALKPGYTVLLVNFATTK